MRRFHSYGPVKCKRHFCIERRALIEECLNSIIDDPEEGGHYFTIWAPRQTGKTWLMHEVKAEIRRRYGDRFIMGDMSMQRVSLKAKDDFLDWASTLIGDTFDIEIDRIHKWKEWGDLFSKRKGIFDRPVILFIDEFDRLLPDVIDELVGIFREMYLMRDNYHLHGLALIGVRAVLGVDSDRGSPFNVQRSIHINNFSYPEVRDLFGQYIEESGQNIEGDVIDKIYDEFRGQPGLTCWMGEVLTEICNQEKDQPITIDHFHLAYQFAFSVLPNNNIQNLLSKVKKEPYKNKVLELFKVGEKGLFNFSDEGMNYLYMNGIIDWELMDRIMYVKFASPFVQKKIFIYLSGTMFGQTGELYHPFEDMDDIGKAVNEGAIHIRSIIKLYSKYLKNNREWLLKDAPRRADLRIFEAVFHFNLYSYLHRFMLRKNGMVYPEFPTGNGKIDLIITYQGQIYGIELKTFTDLSEYEKAIAQAAVYGKALGLREISLIFFVESIDDGHKSRFEVDRLDPETGVNVAVIFVDIGER